MKIEVLVATTNQEGYNLVEKMNIQSDVILGNQRNVDKIEKVLINNNNVRIYTFNERGVGLNRNNALFRSNADICILADDDMVFQDGYPDVVKEAFDNNPNADVLIFNLIDETDTQPVIKKTIKVDSFNYMRFGAARLVFRNKSIKIHGIFFNLCFGGGTEHGFGEDTLFLHDCLRAKLNIYAVPISIAVLKQDRESSWFKGYDEKYFIDKGFLFSVISKRYAKLLCLQDAIRHQNMYKKSFTESYASMKIGIKNYKKKIY